MSEDLKEPATDEAIECEHEKCVVVRLVMYVDFRKNGEIVDAQHRDLAVTHAEHSIQAFLDILGAMSEATLDTASWVMDKYNLPPEIVAMAVRNELKIEVVMHDE